MYRGKEREKKVFDQKIERIDSCFFNAIANNNNNIKTQKQTVKIEQSRNRCNVLRTRAWNWSDRTHKLQSNPRRSPSTTIHNYALNTVTV